MIKYSRRKIFFITCPPARRATTLPTRPKKLNEWLRENEDKIEALFIPSYSPELNPQEYQDPKINTAGKKRAIDKEQLKENINGFMNKKKADRPQVKKYLHH